MSLIRAVDQGKTVTPYYDGMVAQLICHGRDRRDVIRMLRKYLDNVDVRGISTNIPMLKRILDDPAFREGIYDTNYLQEFTARLDTTEFTREMDAASGVAGRSLDLESLRITGTDELKVPAPSAGVFYRTPSPGEPEFVQPGDVVNVHRTLCLLEAMKCFSSLTLATFRVGESALFPAGHLFEVVRIVPENGQVVNRDDLLFVIRPATVGAG
jgi:biotin carboxyl carrier protein